jgi:O-antigen ligase
MRAQGAQHRFSVSDSTLLKAAVISTWCAISFYVANPLAAPLLLIAIAAVAFLFTQTRDQLSFSALALPAALVVWMLLSVLWTPERRPAFAAIALYTAVVPATLVAIVCAGHIPAALRRPVALAFVVAVAVAAWVSLEEMLTDHFLRRALNTYIPLTRPRSVVARTDNGWILALHSFVTNKNVAALMFMFWPALLISRVLTGRPVEKGLRIATVVALAIAVKLSDHESSKLALVVSALVFLIALWSRRIAFGLVAFGWIAATLLIVPASLTAYKFGAYKIEQIQDSGRHRLVIWGQTSERILKKPLLGYGLASTRVIDETAEAPAKALIPGTNIPSGTNVHSHNMFLQVWHEIGAIGALLMMLAGLPVLGWLRTRSDHAAPYLLAAFTTAVCIASFSWSLVAVWYVASFGFMAAWARFADVAARSLSKRDQPSVPDKAWV